jgi:2-methylfumaryl-CoA isomerase
MYPFLQDLRIVECASFIAAPSCALHLQQLGAQVIRIDPIGGGPDFNRWPVAKDGQSFYWEGLNKGKKSVAIDLARPEGRQLAADLITAPGPDAGILVTNFPKDGFLSHERLQKQREDLISVRVMGWSDGESGVDYTVNAALGIPFITGDAESGDRPVNHVLPAWDLLTGAYAAFVTLAAERERLRTRRGQEVTLPLSDVALAALANTGQVAEALHSGDRPRYGNALFGAFGRDFTTRDGERVMVVAITRRQWTGLLKSLQLESVVSEIESRLGVSFAQDEGLRFIHREALFPLFDQAIGARSLQELRLAFDANGVCWGPYMTLQRGLREDPRLSLASPLFDELQHPSGYRYPAPGAAATFGGLVRGPVLPAPRLGEHTDQVLAEVLSLSAARIGELHDAKLVAGS